MNKPLLVLSCDRLFSEEHRENMRDALAVLADKVGMEAMVAEGGVTVSVHRDLQPLVDAITKQTEVMSRLADMVAAHTVLGA